MEEIELVKKHLSHVYEKKKLVLLKVNRTQPRSPYELQLIHEINLLAELLKEQKINKDNISETLRVYPSKIK